MSADTGISPSDVKLVPNQPRTEHKKLRIVYLVCGFKGTGKDTLYSNLAAGQDIRFAVYLNPAYSALRFPGNAIERKSFADPLKDAVCRENKLDRKTMESKKEDIIPALGKSFRDLCIEEAAKQRAKDIDIYCKLTLGNELKSDQTMVTDWRYKSEYEYTRRRLSCCCVTMRVWRRSVPEPAINITSEHDLDDFVCDFVLVPEGEFADLCKRFPAYAKHQRVKFPVILSSF
jgi:hypothetical protein